MEDKLEILVVEDKDENLETARTFFDNRDECSVTYANSTESALELLDERRFEGVLTDMFMPTSPELSEQVYKLLEGLSPIVNPDSLKSFRGSLDAIREELVIEAPTGL